MTRFLTPWLARLRARYQASRLPRFLAWWTGELRALLPRRWQAALRVQRAQVLLRAEADGVVLELDEGGPRRALGRLGLAPSPSLAEFAERLGAELLRLPRVLLLPPTAVLRRRLVLPAAAAGEVAALVAHEIDRQTPFRAEQVWADHRLLPGPPGARQVTAELAVVPRERLDAELARLGELAGELDAVDVTDAEGRRLGFNLLPASRRRPRDHRPLLINLGLVSFSLIMLVTAMAGLVENRRQAVAEVEAEVEARRVEARRTTELRKELEEAARAANFLAEHKATHPSLIALLRDLTDLLPDDTFLERLTITGNDISLVVQSGSAARLVELFQSSPRFAEPTLLGAVQPDTRTGKDRASFTVKAVVPRPEAGP